MEHIPLFPLGNALFPAGVMSLRVFEIRYLDMVRKCIADDAEFGIVPLLRGSEVRTPEGQETLAGTGTMARIEEWAAPMPGLLQLRCRGTTRFHLASSEQGRYGLWTGIALPIPDDAVVEIPPALQDSANALGRLIAQLQQDGIAPGEMPIAAPFRLDESAWVADRWCELLPMPAQQKSDLLALEDPLERLLQVHEYLSSHGLL